MDIPDELIADIHNGECVAFVGAGFSQPVMPGWSQLLRGVAESALDVNDLPRINALIEHGRSKDLEAVAQTLRDTVGAQDFGTFIGQQRAEPADTERMDRRIEWLRGIPFRAVLTTNFDDILGGRPPGRDTYLDVLRPTDHRWWDSRYWGSEQPDRSIVALHGSVSEPDDLVFTRRDYRRRLYGIPGYLTFVRSVMATTTVLYLGFSFTDAYLDELRSEILALLEYRGTDKPIAYALLPDASDEEVAFAQRHEGLQILPYAGDQNHAAFDDRLEEIHRRTNPAIGLGTLLGDAKIVWVDPDVDSVDHGVGYLNDAVEGAGGRATIAPCRDADEAVQLVGTDGADLVITRWGYGDGPDGRPVGEYLLSQMRRRDLRAPVVVFASVGHADENKRAAMALGATGFEHRWQGLFREIERIFTPGSRMT
jgi:hypothetical protein